MTNRYGQLATEQINPRSRHLDKLSALGIVRLMNQEDARVLATIRKNAVPIAQASDRVVRAWQSGGQLFLVGAGTSGRLAVLEAAECPPTFHTPPAQVQALMAGGKKAVFRSQEGAEDSASHAARAIRERVRKGDVVLGIAASGITAYVQAALKSARSCGAQTILLTCNPTLAKSRAAHTVIALDSGAEVLTGSTRLKAGTACKMALNMITTASMVRLGKTYGNQMVDLEPRSKKLVARGLRLVQEIGRVSEKEAVRLFAASGRHAKVAIVMARTGCSVLAARKKLDRAQGFLKGVIG